MIIKQFLQFILLIIDRVKQKRHLQETLDNRRKFYDMS